MDVTYCMDAIGMKVFIEVHIMFVRTKKKENSVLILALTFLEFQKHLDLISKECQISTD